MPKTYEFDKIRKLTINDKQIIICETAIAFKKGPRILGTVKARYDLSDLPDYLHGEVIGMVGKTKVIEL